MILEIKCKVSVTVLALGTEWPYELGFGGRMSSAKLVCKALMAFLIVPLQ